MKILLLTSLLCIPLIVFSAGYDQLYSGRYIRGAEVDVFKPCGSHKVFWVSASSWVKGPLLDFYRSSTRKPYQAIYIEFRGHMLDEEVDGFAADYDGLVRISEIRKKTLVISPQCN
jgi:hypothetical protein